MLETVNVCNGVRKTMLCYYKEYKADSEKGKVGVKEKEVEELELVRMQRENQVEEL